MDIFASRAKAVHLAVETENVKLMQYLVSKNPDMTITNRNGKTARELATTAIDVILSTTRYKNANFACNSIQHITRSQICIFYSNFYYFFWVDYRF